jgi:uncharacterized membrane protein YkvA (DUF1232 family)
VTVGGRTFRTGHGEAGGAPPPGGGDRSADAPAGSDDPDAGRHGRADAGGSGPPADAGELGSLAKVRRLLTGVPAFGKLLYRLLGDDRVSLLDRVIFGAALVYLFVPMDLVPDVLPALGQLDDLLIVGITLDRLLHRTDEAVLAEHWDGDAASLAALKGLLDRAVGVLPGWVRGLLRAG